MNPNIADPFKGRHILVVEDDAFTAELLRFLLARQGMQVTVLGDGRAALDALRLEPLVDAVLLDMRLPQISGMAFLEALRQRPDWADTPVLVLSAVDSGTEVAAALDAGAHDYVTKPFDPAELLARLRRLLPFAGPAVLDAGH